MYGELTSLALDRRPTRDAAFKSLGSIAKDRGGNFQQKLRSGQGEF